MTTAGTPTGPRCLTCTHQARFRASEYGRLTTAEPARRGTCPCRHGGTDRPHDVRPRPPRSPDEHGARPDRSGRPPRRVTPLIAFIRTAPRALLLGLRLVTRRLGHTLLLAVAVAGIVVIMYAQTHPDRSRTVRGKTDRSPQPTTRRSHARAHDPACPHGHRESHFVAIATALGARAALATTQALGASPPRGTAGEPHAE
jgi:hypothetical protein